MEKTKITVPNGTRDLIFEEVTAERELEGRIDGLLDVLGYRPVRTPSVEYYDLFDQSNRYIDETQMYKLTDGDGRLIVLRPDNTAPIARLVSSKLHAEPLPLLIRYGQRVFRSSAAYNALRHEVLQYGVEVIGGDRRSEDLRVLFTAFETLSLCGGDYKIEIGHAQFFDALIDTLELSADEKKAVKAYLAAKNSSMMPFGVSAGLSRALDIARRLPRLCGGAEVLEESRRLAGGSGRAAEIVDYVESVYNAFIESGYADRIIIDMGIVQRIEYYTGLVFKGYIGGIGAPVLSGGRYDQLYSGFGRERTACGFALDVSDVAASRAVSRKEPAEPPLEFSAGSDSIAAAKAFLEKGGRRL